MINQKSDTDLVKNIKRGKNVDESLVELVSRNSGIFINMINAYTPHQDQREMIEDKEYYIYQAALKYDEKKNAKFSTYLGSETRWMCWNIYNKKKERIDLDISLFENIIRDDTTDKGLQHEDSIRHVMNITKQHPDKRVGKIFELRYAESSGNKLTPWSEICDHVGLSVQGSINVHDQAIESIKKKLRKEL